MPEPAAPPKGPYSNLVEIASALEIPYAGAPDLEISRGDVSVHLSLEFNSGRVTGLCLHAPRAGLPEVTLRLETDDDVSGKYRGINVELQLGDREFDPAVYIETDAPDAAMYELLDAPETRSAVVDLVRWCGSVRLDETGVRALTSSLDFFAVDRFLPLLDAFVVVAGLPTVRFSPLDTKEPSGLGLLTLAVTAIPFALGLAAAGLAVYTPESSGIFWIGAGGGLVAWLASWPLCKRAVRGHARSLRHYRSLLAALFVDLVAGGGAASVILNGGLDSAPAEEHVGRIVSVRHYIDDSNPKTEAQVRWRDGHEDQHTFDDDGHQLRAGNPVVIIRRRGRFGFAWVQKDYTAYSGEDAKAH